MDPKADQQHSGMRQLDDLLTQGKQVSAEIDATSRASKKDIEQVSAEVKESTENLNTIFAQLDTADREAGDELDAIVLQEAAAESDQEE
jgi:seryl-tRNA synthetase